MNNPSIKSLKKRESEIIIELAEIEANKQAKKLELNSIKDAIKKLRIEQPKDIGVNIPQEFDIPDRYSDDLTWEDRIIYIINKLEQASIKELTQEVIKLESRKKNSQESVYPIIQQVVIRMIANFKIIKIGKYNSKYKLNRKV